MDMTGLPPNELQNLLSQTAKQELRGGEPAPAATTALVPVRETPPVIIDDRSAPGKAKRKRALRGLLVLVLAGLAALGGFYWWSSRLSPIPAGIVWSNGRIDAEGDRYRNQIRGTHC